MQETFGKYRLIDRLAFGGMAEVFLGSVHGEAGFSKPVVIKRLHPRLSEDDEFTQMLIDEARITSQLNHGNICQVLDLGQVDGTYYIAMEYVPGEDLRTFQDHFRRQKMHMPVGAAVYAVSELLAALDYAHRQEDADGNPLGVIHRDVSPQNVLISYEGDVKIIDFGIAKARQRIVQTQAGVIKGKFRYMSPEQASGGKVDHRTDIFAAGVVLYELLRGEPHSLDIADTEVLKRMRDAKFEPIERGREEVPDELLKLVSRALQRSPRKRYATAGEFGQALVDFLPKLATGSKPGRLFGRMDLESLMKDVFPAERRRRRSGSSHRKAVEKSSARHAEAVENSAQRPAGNLPSQVPVPDPSTDRALPGRDPLLDAPPLPRESTTPIHLEGDRLVKRGADPGEAGLAGGPAARARSAGPKGGGVASDAVPSGGSDPSTARWSGAAVDPPAAPPAEARGRDRPAAGGRRGGSGAGAFTRGAVQPVPQAPAYAPAEGSGQDRTVQEEGDPQWSPAPPALHATRVESRAESTQPSRRRVGSGGGKILAIGVVLALAGGAFFAGRYLTQSEGQRGDLPGFLNLGGQRRTDAGGGELPERPLGGVSSEGELAELRVTSTPSGAAVRLCGKAVGKRTPALVHLRPGRRCKLRLTLRGYAAYEVALKGSPSGRPMSVKARLRRRTATSRPRRGHASARADKGTLIVTSIRIGTVYVNNEAMGRTPKLQVDLPPGHYTVWMVFSGLGVQTGTRSVRIARGGRSRLHFDPTM